jgi:hypothetical protein
MVSVKKCHLAGPIEKLATTFLGALWYVLKIVNMPDITFVKFCQNHYVELSIKTQTKKNMGYIQGYSREGYFCISFCRNPLYTLQQYLDFKF